MSVTGDADDGHEISIPPVPPRSHDSVPTKSDPDSIATSLLLVGLFVLTVCASGMSIIVAFMSDGCLGRSCEGGYISVGFTIAAVWPWLVLVGGLIWVSLAWRGSGKTFWIPLVLAPLLFVGLLAGVVIASSAF